MLAWSHSPAGQLAPRWGEGWVFRERCACLNVQFHPIYFIITYIKIIKSRGVCGPGRYSGPFPSHSWRHTARSTFRIHLCRGEGDSGLVKQTGVRLHTHTHTKLIKNHLTAQLLGTWGCCGCFCLLHPSERLPLGLLSPSAACFY